MPCDGKQLGLPAVRVAEAAVSHDYVHGVGRVRSVWLRWPAR